MHVNASTEDVLTFTMIDPVINCSQTTGYELIKEDHQKNMSALC